MATVNYADAFGIESLPAAIVFAVLYFVLLIIFLFKVVKRVKYVYIILTLFSAIRVAAFILRALLSRVTSIAENLSVMIAYEILFNTGFFGLLYSAYTLVDTRIAVAKNPPNNPISRLLRHRILFRILLMTAVALGITAVNLITSQSTAKVGNTLRQVAIYIFLVGVVLVFLQTLFLARAEFEDRSYYSSTSQIGSTYGVYFLLLISLLLLVREVFFAATANKIAKQNNEAFWYPLSAVPELLAVALFAVPGLVPETPKEP